MRSFLHEIRKVIIYLIAIDAGHRDDGRQSYVSQEFFSNLNAKRFIKYFFFSLDQHEEKNGEFTAIYINGNTFCWANVDNRNKIYWPKSSTSCNEFKWNLLCVTWRLRVWVNYLYKCVGGLLGCCIFFSFTFNGVVVCRMEANINT